MLRIAIVFLQQLIWVVMSDFEGGVIKSRQTAFGLD